MKSKKVLRVNNLKLKPDHTADMLVERIKKELRLKKDDVIEYEIAKRAIDARHKPDILYVYSIDVLSVKRKGKKLNLDKLVSGSKNGNIKYTEKYIYEFPGICERELTEEERPVIIGFGPAGMFAALKLSEAGYRPIIYERGDNVDRRRKKVDDFWKGSMLDTESNVQFGEGGAGTFSDGKLNTVIKDPTGRIREVLNTFVKFGAGPDILYANKPHVGTDVLCDVVKNIREYCIQQGAEIYFNCRVDKIITEGSALKEIEVSDTALGKSYTRKCKFLCAAIGHSARDTFEMLDNKGIVMEPKAFAVGFRIMHNQAVINENAYGNCTYNLGAADYKVTYTTKNQKKPRGVYSFCMCPGGYVVNASSEKGYTAVNGMSYSGRNSNNANSAMIVTVEPEDFGFGILDGVKFQRRLEKEAFNLGKGKVPIQLFGDFDRNVSSSSLGGVKPCIKGEYTLSNLNSILPEELSKSLKEGIHGCSRLIKDFDNEEAVLAGVESRTSSPVRILRNDNLESVNCKGLYPCGEGAGYAGGITSAAVDGIKVAEKIAQNIDFMATL
ncbi:MAG: FAD-dependent oxidoreductase [Eubacteriales bacterium]|nr:FAD-dependent oxidoreductase [Eubacteriales bacterium]